MTLGNEPFHWIIYFGVSWIILVIMYARTKDDKKKFDFEAFAMGYLVGAVWPFILGFGLLFLAAAWPVFLYKFFKDGWATKTTKVIKKILLYIASILEKIIFKQPKGE